MKNRDNNKNSLKKIIGTIVISFIAMTVSSESISPNVRTIRDIRAQLEKSIQQMVACTSEVVTCEEALAIMRGAYEAEEIAAFSNNYPTAARREAATLSKILLRPDIDKLFHKYINGSSIALEAEFRRAWIQLRDSSGQQSRVASIANAANAEVTSINEEIQKLKVEIRIIEGLISKMPNEANKAPLRMMSARSSTKRIPLFADNDSQVETVSRITGISLSQTTTENWKRVREQLYNSVDQRNEQIKHLSSRITSMNNSKSSVTRREELDFDKLSLELSQKYYKSLHEDLPMAIVELESKWMVDLVQLKVAILKQAKPLVGRGVFTTAQGAFLNDLDAKFREELTFARRLSLNGASLSHGRTALEVLTIDGLLDYKKDFDQLLSYLEVAEKRAIASEEAARERARMQKAPPKSFLARTFIKMSRQLEESSFLRGLTYVVIALVGAVLIFKMCR